MTVFDCYFGEKGCLRGNETGASLCRPGHKGPMCGLCEIGYYRSDFEGSCAICSDSLSTSSLVVLLVVLVVGVLGLILYWFIHYFLPSRSRRADDKISGLFVERITFGDNPWMDRLKIIATTIQIISNNPTKLHLDLTPIFKGLQRIFSFVQFDFLGYFPLSCRIPFNFTDSVFYSTLIPPVIALVLAIIYFISCLMAKIMYGNKLSSSPKWHNFFGIFLIVTYFMLPELTLKIFKVFVCIDIDPARESEFLVETERMRLAADLSINCETVIFI